MKKILSFYLSLALLPLFADISALAQQQDDDKMEKQMLEFVDSEVKRLSSLLDLEYWQEFYVDSTLTYNYSQMTEELKELQKAKVENADLYSNVRDKWLEATDQSYRRIFTDEQWRKYWKNGGERASKARNKRKK